MFTMIAAGAFLFGFSTAAFSQPADRFDHTVRNKFFAGFSGDKAAMAEAMKICEEVLAANPDHAEALVWHGAGVFARSGDAFRAGDMANAQTLLNEGVAEMDRAVKLQPDHIGVRVPRGAVLITASRFMPEEIGRPLLDRGLNDYEHVMDLQRAYFDNMGTHPKGELLFGLAEGWNRAGQIEKATAYFNRIVTDMPETPYAKRASKWLATKSLDRSETGCIGCHVKK
jgi:tetratricopeptide (TPR) repeat protein